MSAYTRRQLLVYCTLTAAVTVIAGGIFAETAYQPVRETVVSWIRGDDSPPAPAATPRPRSADLRDSTTLAVLSRRSQEIMEARESQLGVDKQKELMSLWHELRIWQNLWYLGIRIQKNPMDTWMMQQVIYDVQPDFIIETGTAYGGSALLWAHVLNGLGLEDSRVLTIDITDYNQQAAEQPLWQKHVQFFHGSSTDPEIVSQIGEMVAGKKVLVALDSNHAGEHVLDELRAYGPMVSPGSYIVAEDTNLDALPLREELAHLDGGYGPMWAVLQFLDEEDGQQFEQDLTRENFVLTFNPGGWLKRKTSTGSGQ
ncbi:MAG: cephalosporin hydroxylase family protein [Gemmatimonadota bacterium]|nr:cephalosporin hydroxylase family protein [Gemmatimonadota bacterium]